jgi:hypothetical protein
MGLDKDVRSWIQTSPHFVPHHHKLDKSPCQTVIFDDIMVRMYAMTGPRGNGKFTGDELYNEIWRPAHTSFHFGKCRLYIGLMDNQSMVPKRKAGTQAKRDTNRRKAASDTKKGVEKYTDPFVINGLGLRYTMTGREELIDIKRLLATRHARIALCVYISERLRVQAITGYNGGVILFDYADQKNGPVVSGCGHQRFTGYIHPFGEADMMAGFWSWVYRKNDQLFITTDTDWVPIILHVLSLRGDDHTNTVFIRLKPDVYTDLVGMKTAICKGMGMSIKAFLFLCVLGGTDYHGKSTLIRGISGKDIIAMFTTDTGIALLEQVCITEIHAMNWTESWDNELSSFYKRDVQRHGITDCLDFVRSTRAFKSDDTAVGVDNVLWNGQYWGFGWVMIVVPPPISFESASRKRKTC